MIEVENASVTADGTTLLPPTTLTVERGEVVALRGANGSGKTTVLRLIAGQVAPSAGRVAVAGEPPRRRDPRFRGRVAGMLGLPPFARDLTLLEHATLVAVTWGMPVPTARDASLRVMDAAGLGDLAHRFPHELSSGQTQLAGLSLTLLRPAEVLLLDEPEQRLDGERLALMTAVLRERLAAGVTLVLATHSRRVVDDLGARVVRLDTAA